MRILFVHKHCPGQFVHLAKAFAADPRNEVVFVAERADAPIPGVRIETFAPSRASAPPTHHYLQATENAVLLGQAAYRVFTALRRDGFLPDLIYAHAGFGPGLYIKDAFPQTPLIGHFEWFYRARGSDADFLPGAVMTEDEALRIRTRNATLLLELAQCDRGICPTRFQRDQFPAEFQSKLTVVHEGVDTGYFAPAADDAGPIEGLPADAARDTWITYAARGLEPYRGFIPFMQAADLILRRRRDVRVIVLGDDNVYYGRPRDDGRSWREAIVELLPGLDLGRVHFLGRVPLDTYRRVLRVSRVHSYLTVPFVLSWSLVEAMATGCALVASDTAPVRELVRDGKTGLLADFHDPEGIAAHIERLIDNGALRNSLGISARRHATTHFRLGATLARHLALAETVTGRPLRRSARGGARGHAVA